VPRRRRILFVPLAAGILGLCGCGPSAPTGSPPQLVTVKRLVDDKPATLPTGFAWGAYASLAGDARITLTSFTSREALAAAVTPPAPDATTQTWTVDIPESWRDRKWVGVQPMARLDGQGGVALPFQLVSPARDGMRVGIDGGDLAHDTWMAVRIAPVPALDARDIVSEPFVVAPGAVLGFGAGLEPRGPSGTPFPVEFRVAVVADGRETVVQRTTVNGVRPGGAWVDARADLGAFAGRTIRLRLSTAGADPARESTALPLWADPVVLVPQRSHMMNVVLLSLDTLRARSVGTYGCLRPTTPWLDRFGTQGVVFDAAYTTAPHTLPAHVSVFSGLYLRTHTIRSPRQAIPPTVSTLTEHLRDAGYETAAFTEDGFVDPGVGIRRGFATYRENTSPNLHEPLGQAAATFGAGIEWLGRHRDQATFLFLHTYQVHFPYTPLPPYDQAFEPTAEPLDPDQRDLLRYEQETRYLDDQVQRVLDAIDGLGLGVRTLVVVMSDHGEEFMEHGQRTHGFQLYDESTHVPLMMRLPGAVPAGLRVEEPVSLVDVAPTILDLVGATPLVGADGQSLVPLLGAGKEKWDRRAVFAETYSSLVAHRSDLLSTRTPLVHCIFRTGRGTAECYDPAIDPDERSPLVGRERDIMAARNQTVVYGALKPIEPAAAPVEATTPAAQDERTEKLRALGYVE